MYEGTPLSVDQQQLERRRKLLEAMQGQVLQPSQTQMVSGRAVPQGIGEGLTKLLQAYMVGKGQKDIGAQEKELAGKYETGRSDATQRVMEAMMGAPENAPPMGEAGPVRPAVEPDYTKAAMTAATDPYLQQSQGLQGVTQALMKGKTGGGSMSRPIPTSEGYYAPTGDGWELMTGAQGAPLMPVYGDPGRQAEIAGQKTRAVLGAEGDLKPDVEGDVAYTKGLMGEAAKSDIAQYESATKSAENINKIDDLIAHIDSSDAITGLGADLFKNIERVKVLVSDSEAAGKKVSDTELLDVLLGSEVFPMIGELGIGARGMDTPAEREFLRSVMTGQIGMNKDTIRKMAMIRKNIAQRSIDRWNNRVETPALDKFFKSTGLERKKVQYEAAPSGAGGQKGGVPEGVDPAIWDAMTPEEKALF